MLHLPNHQTMPKLSLEKS